MELKLELVLIPVSDVDRAKAFYTEKLGWSLDVDHQPSDSFRVVQMTPPGSACSITIGIGITEAAPGSYRGTHLVVYDIDAAREELVSRGVEVSDVRHFDREEGEWRPGSDPEHSRLRLVRRLRRSRWKHLGPAGGPEGQTAGELSRAARPVAARRSARSFGGRRPRAAIGCPGPRARGVRRRRCR